MDTETSYVCIAGRWVSAPDGAIGYKYSDPSEDARWVYDPGDLADIIREDPALIELVQSDTDVSAKAASWLGRAGGRAASPAKRAAARANGRKGGRPRKRENAE